jgi:hypothetical protein
VKRFSEVVAMVIGKILSVQKLYLCQYFNTRTTRGAERKGVVQLSYLAALGHAMSSCIVD